MRSRCSGAEEGQTKQNDDGETRSMSEEGEECQGRGIKRELTL